jgi:hypothetical protein
MESEEWERLDEYLVWSLVWCLGIPSDFQLGLGELALFIFLFFYVPVLPSVVFCG